MDFTGKDWDFAENCKFFAIGHQGVFYDFSTTQGHGHAYAAGLWAWLLEMERRLAQSGKKIQESHYEIRKRLMGQVLKKLEERDLEDLLTLIEI